MKSYLKQFLNNYWILSCSRNRDNFVKEWLQSLDNGTSILDAGAGFQRYKRYANHLKYFSQDFGEYEGGENFGNKKAPDWDSKKCDYICDITNIPVEDNMFDNVMCTEVFEHLPNPLKAFEELSRILKKGGKILITAPFRCLYHQEPYFYYSGFSTHWYEYIAEQNDLEITLLKPNGNYYQDVGFEILRIARFGGLFQRFISLFFTIPMLGYLFFIEKIQKLTSPESCWGYYVIFKKK